MKPVGTAILLLNENKLAEVSPYALSKK